MSEMRLEYRVNRCLDPEECSEKQSHIRVGNEIHHCHAGVHGCECPTCMRIFWGAFCGDQRIREYIGGNKDARDYDGSDNPNALDMLNKRRKEAACE